MNIRAHVIISGRVQGVFYRVSTRDIAEQLGVRGWVKNKTDNRVEAVFEGEETAVKNIISWCHKGPPSASVSGVVVDYQKFLGEFQNFTVKY